jgi:rod shape-determining protein MreB and related proteins
MRFFVASRDMGIDLGTSNTLIYVKGKGILLKEPSVVAINTINNEILAVGSEAKKMIGRTPGDIVTISPIINGVVANLEITQQMIKKFIEKVAGKGTFKSTNIVICHPAEVTEVEKRVIHDVTSLAGASKVMLIDEPVAAALGAGLPVNEPIGSMIVDIGGGTTEVSVISLGGIVNSQTLKVAGYQLDETILNYIKKEYNLCIGEITAERIKIEIGSVYTEDHGEERTMEVSGRDLLTGLPRFIIITESEIREALREPISVLTEAIRTTLEQTAPELAADIMDNGITLTGGGALLGGLDELVSKVMNIPVYVAENPVECVALGAGKCLDVIDKIRERDIAG